MKLIETIHEHQIGVHKVYKMASTITEDSTGFNVWYNKRKISFYVSKNHKDVVASITKTAPSFTETTVHSDEDLSDVLIPMGFKKGASTAVDDNLIIFDNLDAKKSARIRRAKSFVARDGFEIIQASRKQIHDLTEAWVQQKMEDEKVFKITFNPNRYRNAIQFIDVPGYTFYNVAYQGKLIASIAFYNHDGVAHHLTYISDQTAERVVNDQYELILWAAFADRFDAGIKTISMGTSGGIKSLAAFKKKFYTDTQSGFQFTRKNEAEKKIINTDGLF